MSTGYRCKECVNAQKKTFENALWADYLLGFFTAAILSGIASAIVGFISNWFYGFGVLFFAPFAATLIVRGAQAATNRRRSRTLFIVITVGVVLGGLPSMLGGISTLLFIFSNPEYMGNFSIFWLLPVIWQGVYLFIATPAVYAGLSGFTIK
jgi:type IV secretory pathway TrbD component